MSEWAFLCWWVSKSVDEKADEMVGEKASGMAALLGCVPAVWWVAWMVGKKAARWAVVLAAWRDCQWVESWDGKGAQMVATLAYIQSRKVVELHTNKY